MDNKHPVEGKKRGFKQRTSSKGRPWWKRLWGWTKFGEKSGWEYLELLSALAIPVVLAVAGFWFTAQQDQRQQKIENQRAEAERELAVQRAQDEALQAYLDQMSSLLLEENLRASADDEVPPPYVRPRSIEEDSPAQTLARARTLTVLSSLDASRKQEVMRFLWEANLIQGTEEKESVIALFEADLRDVDLVYADLVRADLQNADLSDADLSRADLSEAILRGANLRGATLVGANLKGTDLGDADLRGADLRGTTTLNTVNSDNIPLPSDDVPYLVGADLRGADLRNTDILGVNWRGVNWREEAVSLEGATMPNGQKYEDWLKSKGRGQDGENNGPS